MRARYLILVATLGCAGTTAETPGPRTIPDLSRFVDPLIGTKGHGNSVPGPCVPHGMVKLSPDTDAEQGSIDAYDWEHDRIEGFSHTHLQGPGGTNNGYSQVLVMPLVGEVRTDRDRYASRYDHATEVAVPGYYAVTLEDAGIRAELTATRRCGVHRYTFPAATAAHLILDAAHTRGEPRDGRVEVVGRDTIRGKAVHQVNPLVALGVGDSAPGTTGISTVYFHARASRPFASHGTWSDGVVTAGSPSAAGTRVGAFGTFATAAGEVVELRVGISFISEDEAKAALDAECADRAFDEVRAAAVAEWNRLLSRIEVEGGTDAETTMFYTALYHALMQPADYTEGGRFWIGADGFGKVVEAGRHRWYTDDWCTWDTFRTTHPLLTFLEPEVKDAMVQSLARTYEHGGWMQKCPWNATGDSRVMSGNSEYCVVADAVAKGFDGFDLDLALAALEHGANHEFPNPMSEGGCGYVSRGTVPDYVERGWVAYECDYLQSASMTLEYAYEDSCVAVVAEAAGRGDRAAFYRARSGNWKNVFDPSVGMARPRWRDGSWLSPFDPTALAGFTEANSWQYTWSVQHDVCGLVAAMGGREAFTRKLDEFFDGRHFTADNEPDFHVPWLYGYVGLPSRTQTRVAEVRRDRFGDRPDGLPGNDDAGATSAWYAFAAMGFYPVAPGEEWYWLNAPAFDRVTIHLEPDRIGGRTFVIEAPGASAGKPFARGVTLDGEALAEARISHADLLRGGVLQFEMAEAADDAWARPICP